MISRTSGSAARLLEARGQLRLLRHLGVSEGAVAILSARLLRGCLDLESSAWTAVGAEQARLLARGLLRAPLVGLPPAALHDMGEVLRLALERPAGPGDDPALYRRLLESGLEALREGADNLSRILEGNFSAEPEPGGGRQDVSVLIATSQVRWPFEIPAIFQGIPLPGAVVTAWTTASPRPWGRLGRSWSLEPHPDPSVIERLEEIVNTLDAFATRGAPRAAACSFASRIGAPPVHLAGRSASAALQLAAAVARANLAPVPFCRQMMPRTVFIGDVEGTRVCPVEASTLQEKLEACFYAPVDRVYVPHEQFAAGRAIVEPLAERHPRRALEIRPFRDTLDVWRSHAVTRILIRSGSDWATTLVDRLRGSRTFLSLSVLLIFALVGLGAYELHQTERDPSFVRFSDTGDLVAVNRYDRTIWRAALSPPPARTGTRPDLGQQLMAADITQDKRCEVIAISSNADLLARRLTVFDRSGHTLWTRESTEEVRPEFGDVERLQWSFFAIPPCTAPPRPIIAVRQRDHGDFALIDLLNPESGALYAEIGLAGHVRCLSGVRLAGEPHTLVGAGGGTARDACALLVIVDATNACATGGAATIIPGLVTDGITQAAAGYLRVFRFPASRYANSVVPEVIDVRPGGTRCVAVEVLESGAEGSVIYELDLGARGVPRVRDVTFSDEYLVRLSLATPQLMRAERLRMGASVDWMTPAGWQRLEGPAGYDPAAATPGRSTLEP